MGRRRDAVGCCCCSYGGVHHLAWRHTLWRNGSQLDEPILTVHTRHSVGPTIQILRPLASIVTSAERRRFCFRPTRVCFAVRKINREIMNGFRRYFWNGKTWPEQAINRLDFGGNPDHNSWVHKFQNCSLIYNFFRVPQTHSLAKAWTVIVLSSCVSVLVVFLPPKRILK